MGRRSPSRSAAALLLGAAGLLALSRHGSAKKAAGNAKFYGPGAGGNLELVEELEPGSFASAKAGKAEWLIEFYAPWCPHCQHYKPEYAKIAARVSALTCDGGAAGPAHAVHIGAVNCVLQKGLCQSEGISSYPTVKVFDGSGAEGVKQGGQSRTEKAIVAHLTQHWQCVERDPSWRQDLKAARADAAAAQATAAEPTSPTLPTAPLSQIGEAAAAGRRHDITETVWFTLKTGVFIGR